MQTLTTSLGQTQTANILRPSYQLIGTSHLYNCHEQIYVSHLCRTAQPYNTLGRKQSCNWLLHSHWKLNPVIHLSCTHMSYENRAHYSHTVSPVTYYTDAHAHKHYTQCLHWSLTSCVIFLSTLLPLPLFSFKTCYTYVNIAYYNKHGGRKMAIKVNIMSYKS